ncbi:MAG: hypothetical protein ACO36I_14980 [Candidatus Latescibacterota bacterium]
MQKNKDILLTLSAEDRNAAKSFVTRRLKTLDKEQLSELQVLTQLSKQIIRRTQIDKGQYARDASRIGQLMTKLHDAALADLQGLVKQLEQTSYTVHQKAMKDEKKKDGKAQQDDQKAEDLIITCDEKEIQYATEVLNNRIESLRVAELKLFRDTCQEILSWWESERGQIESLHLNELGNINSASGRLAIRQQREKMQRDIFNPFKAFFRQINTSYQRTSKDAANKARMRAVQQRNLEKT